MFFSLFCSLNRCRFLICQPVSVPHQHINTLLYKCVPTYGIQFPLCASAAYEVKGAKPQVLIQEIAGLTLVLHNVLQTLCFTSHSLHRNSDQRLKG